MTARPLPWPEERNPSCRPAVNSRYGWLVASVNYLLGQHWRAMADERPTWDEQVVAWRVRDGQGHRVVLTYRTEGSGSAAWDGVTHWYRIADLGAPEP